MALLLTGPTARLTLAVCLSTLLVACATDKKPSVTVIEEPRAQAEDPFTEEDLQQAGFQVVDKPAGAYIDASELEEDAPEAYTVVKGDTLWDISGMFLKKPWLWPEIWDYNPQIENPHLIYPGDVLALEYTNGRPSLVLTRQGQRFSSADSSSSSRAGNSGAERRSPRIRYESLDESIPTISAESIQAFLLHPRVVDADTIVDAPYIVGNYDNRLISALGHKVFARGELDRNHTAYSIFRKNKALHDPISNELLGYEVTHVADARLLSTGDPSTLAITGNKMETMNGDILLPSHQGSIAHSYTPRLPALNGEGRVVSLVNAIAQAGRNQVIVLNIGEESGFMQGDVLAIETRGNTITDKRGPVGRERITLPNQRTGVLMIFKTYEKVSYALVMESTRPVMVNDIITGI